MPQVSKKLRYLHHYDKNKHFSKGRFYTINEGDTLSSIATLEYGTAKYWPYIWLNNINFCTGIESKFLSPLFLQPGDVITLPLLNDILIWHSKTDTNTFNSFHSLTYDINLQKIIDIVNRGRLANEMKCNATNLNSNTNSLPTSKPNLPSPTKINNSYPTYTAEFKGLNQVFPLFKSVKYGEMQVKLEFAKGKITGKPVTEVSNLLGMTLAIDKTPNGTEKSIKYTKDLTSLAELAFKDHIQKIELSVELNKDAIKVEAELKINDYVAKFGIDGKNKKVDSYSAKKETEVAKGSDSKNNANADSFSVKLDLGVELSPSRMPSLAFSGKCLISSLIGKKIFAKGTIINGQALQDDVEYGLYLDEIELSITIYITVYSQLLHEYLKELFLKNAKKVIDLTKELAARIEKVIQNISNKAQEVISKAKQYLKNLAKYPKANYANATRILNEMMRHGQELLKTSTEFIKKLPKFSTTDFIKLTEAVERQIIKAGQQLSDKGKIITKLSAELAQSIGRDYGKPFFQIGRELVRYGTELVRNAFQIAMRSIAMAMIFLSIMFQSLKYAYYYLKDKIPGAGRAPPKGTNKKPPSKPNFKPRNRNKKETKKPSNQNTTSNYSTTSLAENLVLDFSDDEIQILPAELSGSPKPTVAYLDYEYSSTLTDILRRRYMLDLTSWDLHKLNRSLNSSLEHRIQEDSIKNGAVPFSFRFASAFSIPPSGNGKNLYYTVDQQTGNLNLSTEILITGAIFIGVIATVAYFPIIAGTLAISGTFALATK